MQNLLKKNYTIVKNVHTNKDNVLVIRFHKRFHRFTLVSKP